MHTSSARPSRAAILGVMVFRLGFGALCAFALAACAGGAQLLGFTQSSASCGPPPPVAVPTLWFAYPGDGAQNVPTTIGELVFAGFGATAVDLAATGPVPTGPLVPAPSPLPSPLVTPPPERFGTNVPYLAASVGPLAPATSYTVSFSYRAFTGVAPDCYGTRTVPLGAFTTH